MPNFRRRPFRRRRRPFLADRRRPPPAARAALRQLKQAHELMDQNQPAEAAIIFDTLAEKGAKRLIPRAPQLYLQAGRAWIVAGEIERGMERLDTGLDLMVQMKQLRRLPVVSQRILTELKDHGLTDQAMVFEVKINDLFATYGLSLAAASTGAQKPRLPAKCTYCGGNVLPDEVEWFDNQQASCTYCGSLLEALT
ncbi:MAG: hypothetical protein JSV37_04940 [Anaerolineaceae bacterium]|nr:MAG: hypothetical protein JSV37_04940 [Anaerolineaceae bacterium]